MPDQVDHTRPSRPFSRAARALRNGEWAERIVESGRPPRWRFSSGLTCGEATMDLLWVARLAQDVQDREGHRIVVARTTANDLYGQVDHE
jgi:hypothetical protein